MSVLSIRVIAAVLVVVALAWQARRASGERRRRAFATGALAFALIGVGNLLALLGASGWPIYLPTLAGLAALVASLITLFAAYRAGELTQPLERARDRLLDERRRHEEPARQEQAGDRQ